MPDESPLTWPEFARVDMRVGTVISATLFPEARNPSYILVIDFGPLGQRKTSAQITDLYLPEDLLGRQVIAVVNFRPKQIANMMSECLVLGAVGDDKAVNLLRADFPVENGIRIA